MAEDDTSIRVDLETWRRLQARKTEPGQSFKDVINELLDEIEEGQ